MAEKPDVTIYHNPACGASRNALAAIRAAGHEPKVVEYLKTGWTAPQLQGLLAAIGARPHDLLRVRGTPAEALGLTGSTVSDADLLAAMVAHPVLVERPIVVGPKGAVLARPFEKALETL